MANKRRVYGPTIEDALSTLNDTQSRAVAMLVAELEIAETLYVVTADGINHPYGGWIYLIGVYDTKEKAQKVCEENKEWEADITEITVNETCPLTKDRDGDYFNKYSLGGYEE